ncbi:hypothetical protein E2C01_043082 [Portunus trituberculatus]|uniref:Uncharacterized protein n=1 Tax=Portunus trituberculatus TaxID=210409 RepID=A0A5B7FYF1_PORTR|nr:hypothetical protein [Portunus trituberculatus]
MLHTFYDEVMFCQDRTKESFQEFKSAGKKERGELVTRSAWWTAGHNHGHNFSYPTRTFLRRRKQEAGRKLSICHADRRQVLDGAAQRSWLS